ncbi:hypothetical protein RvY_04512-1 [Ramazzottius varieornatus]|uniref:Uncharacterized protein n=1 Tax=Ramazzottius varieornatus TaxID=947166 RepID=A0A1D1UV82_RAMVA|nr:hypothetical protein RvY_04512-1 [Ramazzottius varieornatus]
MDESLAKAVPSFRSVDRNDRFTGGFFKSLRAQTDLMLFNDIWRAAAVRKIAARQVFSADELKISVCWRNNQGKNRVGSAKAGCDMGYAENLFEMSCRNLLPAKGSPSAVD